MREPSEKPLLLTIDDEPIIRSGIAAYFEDSGLRVMEAADGAEGIERIRADHPDVVITDLRMPRVDGLDVVKAVHRFDETLPVIVLSGTGVLDDAIEALRQGAWDYLTKPLQNIAELEIVVNRCLERSRLMRENRHYSRNLEQLVATRTAALRKLSIAVEQSANTVVITDVNGRIEYVNPKFSETSGYSREEALGSTPRVLKSGKHSDAQYRELWREIQAGREWRGEFCNRRKNGELYWEMCSIAPLRNDDGVVTNFVAIKEDITERKTYEENLYHKANFDTLTGLPNRYHLQTFLEEQLKQVVGDSTLLNLILLDIDRLKFINDTFGHDFGDLLLVEVGQRLRHVCGNDYFVAHFMGNEFVVVPASTLATTDPASHAEMVRNALNDPFLIDGTEVSVTISTGVVTFPEDGECITTLLKNAEAAMHQAKKSGRNIIEYYSRELNNRQIERFELEAKLSKALERGEFSIHYQPQIRLHDGVIIGMEALLRWTPEGESPVSPALFIPLLEESGLIVAVGEWVLWEACGQAMQWQQGGFAPLRMSVNLSALQFMRSDLDITVKRVLDTVGLDPALLCLELTESMLMIDSVQTMQTIAALRATGAKLSMDDFGTGYSSLAYLGRMPINELKIDQSFVRRMFTTSNDEAVVSTVIAMGHGLNMELVAEGVETVEQLRFLGNKGCQIVQGFLFSRPLPAPQFDQFVREWQPERLTTLLQQ
jgi:diguanylate cyclase (GGDEF)-like protein/PAS domain S-box-containing protein